jgi:hypothetical protein
MSQTNGTNAAKYKKFELSQGGKKNLTLYASPKILAALNELLDEMTLYKGVRFGEVVKAVYRQGLKDGRREVIEKWEGMKKQIKYRLPGRPSTKSINPSLISN